MRLPLRPEFVAIGALALFAGGVASAQDVRVTVAEYSSLTGPYFEEAAAAFEAANPGADIQIEVVPWDVLLQKLTTDISGGPTPTSRSSARAGCSISSTRASRRRSTATWTTRSAAGSSTRSSRPR